MIRSALACLGVVAEGERPAPASRRAKASVVVGKLAGTAKAVALVPVGELRASVEEGASPRGVEAGGLMAASIRCRWSVGMDRDVFGRPRGCDDRTAERAIRRITAGTARNAAHHRLRREVLSRTGQHLNSSAVNRRERLGADSLQACKRLLILRLRPILRQGGQGDGISSHERLVQHENGDEP